MMELKGSILRKSDVLHSVKLGEGRLACLSGTLYESPRSDQSNITSFIIRKTVLTVLARSSPRSHHSQTPSQYEIWRPEIEAVKSVYCRWAACIIGQGNRLSSARVQLESLTGMWSGEVVDDSRGDMISAEHARRRSTGI